MDLRKDTRDVCSQELVNSWTRPTIIGSLLYIASIFSSALIDVFFILINTCEGVSFSLFVEKKSDWAVYFTSVCFLSCYLSNNIRNEILHICKLSPSKSQRWRDHTFPLLSLADVDAVPGVRSRWRHAVWYSCCRCWSHTSVSWNTHITWLRYDSIALFSRIFCVRTG